MSGCGFDSHQEPNGSPRGAFAPSSTDWGKGCEMKPATTFRVVESTMLNGLDVGGEFVIVGIVKSKERYSIRPLNKRGGLRPVKTGFSHAIIHVDRSVEDGAIEITGFHAKLLEELGTMK